MPRYHLPMQGGSVRQSAIAQEVVYTLLSPQHYRSRVNPSGSLLPRSSRGRRAGDEGAAPSKTRSRPRGVRVGTWGCVGKFKPDGPHDADCPSSSRHNVRHAWSYLPVHNSNVSRNVEVLRAILSALRAATQHVLVDVSAGEADCRGTRSRIHARCVTPTRSAAGCCGLGDRRWRSMSWTRPRTCGRPHSRGSEAKRGSPRVEDGGHVERAGRSLRDRGYMRAERVISSDATGTLIARASTRLSSMSPLGRPQSRVGTIRHMVVVRRMPCTTGVVKLGGLPMFRISKPLRCARPVRARDRVKDMPLVRTSLMGRCAGDRITSSSN